MNLSKLLGTVRGNNATQNVYVERSGLEVYER